MPLDKELLDILVCPDTKAPVAMADAGVLERLNAAVAEGRAKTLGGEPVDEPVDEGLLREDGRILYPIRQGIPVMLIDESIDVSDL